MADLGLVIIGRNEGLRLQRCLKSALEGGAPVVYVDSGSTDGSVALARSFGVDRVVELDPARPFSAARARNEGFAALRELCPDLRLVQFVDGDCDVFAGWLEQGRAALAADPRVVVVAGLVRERLPEISPYNRLCALEWQRPAGEIEACGGIFMARAEAFGAAGGFRTDVVAGEEGELCLRLRRQGGRVLQLDVDMVWHDAAMTRFRQWWQRARRAGHAYAQGAHLHGSGPERHCVREVRRILGWGLLLPALAMALAWPTRGWSLTLLLAYPLQALRLAAHGRHRGWPAGDALLYAGFTVLDKLPGVVGLVQFHWRRLTGRAPTIIEHKRAGPAL